MTGPFAWTAHPSRVVFAPGALQLLPDEVDRLGGERVLLIGSGPSSRNALLRLRGALGARVAAEIPESARHVPDASALAAVMTARDAGVDIVVSVGGGSATGLGKAVAVKCDLPLVAVPTTYAGSEMTPTWGATKDGVKTTAIDLRALPRAVVYDPELCRGMPGRLAAASGMNALAHCIEAFWSAGRNPITSTLADEGIRQLLDGLPRVVANPDDVDAHGSNLVGASLAGLCVAQAGIGPHHRACHVLGGGWNLPHAETHAIVLPHATALVAPTAPGAMNRLARLLGNGSPAEALFHLLRELGLPISLEELGMPVDALDEATSRVGAAVRDDPLVPDSTAIRSMVTDAFFGRDPRR